MTKKRISVAILLVIACLLSMFCIFTEQASAAYDYEIAENIKKVVTDVEANKEYTVTSKGTRYAVAYEFTINKTSDVTVGLTELSHVYTAVGILKKDKKGNYILIEGSTGGVTNKEPSVFAELDKGTYYAGVMFNEFKDSAKMTIYCDNAFVSADDKDKAKDTLVLYTQMKVGDTLTLYADTNADKVTYKSSKSSVAKVTSKGKITAKKAGTAVITVKAGTKTVKYRIKVVK